MNKRTDFSKIFSLKVIQLMGVSTMAYGITFIFSIYILRNFLPQHIGFYTTFQSGLGIMSILATGQFHHALFTEKTEEWSDIFTLIGVLSLICIVLGEFILIPYYFFKSEINIYILFLYPMALFVSVCNNVAMTIALRVGKNSLIVANKTWVALFPPLITVIISFFYRNEVSLILGYYFGLAIATLVLIYKLPKVHNSKRSTVLSLYRTINKLKNFAKFTLPSEFTIYLTNQLPIIFLNLYADIKVVGNYSIATKILNIPLSIISSSIGLTMKQGINETIAGADLLINLLKRSVKLILKLGLFPMVIIFMVSDFLVQSLYGTQWSEAGSIIQILSIVYITKLIVGPITYIFQITNNQKQAFKLALYQMVMLIVAFLISYFIYTSWQFSLKIYAVVFTFIGIYMYRECFRIARNYSGMLEPQPSVNNS